MYRKPKAGTALIRTGLGGMKISAKGKGMLALPFLHRVEELPLTVTIIQLSFTGRDSLLCKDDATLALEAHFTIRVNTYLDDIQELVTRHGCRNAADERYVTRLFEPKLIQTLRNAGSQFTADEILKDPVAFQEEFIVLFGMDHDGFKLHDAAFDIKGRRQ